MNSSTSVNRPIKALDGPESDVETILMATQSQLAHPAPVEDPSNAQHKPDGGGTAQGGPESDLAWEIVKEECHDSQ